MTLLPRGVRRHQLPLSEDDLRALRTAVDASLNVPAAKAAEQAAGRDAAVELLRGEPILQAALRATRGGVAKRRTIELAPPAREKRRSGRPGRSNWPRTAEERLKLKLRCEERKALGLRSRRAEQVEGVEGVADGDATRTHHRRPTDDAYRPTVQEALALWKLVAHVAERAGVAPTALSPPHALVTMIPEESAPQRMRRERDERERVGVSVAVHENAAAMQFLADEGGDGSNNSISTVPMEAGEGLVYDKRREHRHASGDWRRSIVFDVDAAALN